MNSDTFILELGQQHIMVADFKVAQKKIVPIAAGIQRTNANFYLSQADDILKSVAATTKALLSETKITKKNVVVLIPESHSFTSIKEMPSLTEKELISAIRYQADQFIPMPMDKVNLDIEVLFDDKKNKKLLTLLVAAPIALTERVVEFVESLGLIPVVLENEASASSRLLEYYLQAQQQSKDAPKTGTTLVVHFGYSSSSLFLLDLALGIPIQIHAMSTGVELFIRDIKTNLQQDEAKCRELFETYGFGKAPGNIDLATIVQPIFSEFIADINRFIASLREDKTKGPIQNILLYGHGAKLVGIDKLVQEKTAIPTSLFQAEQFLEKNIVTDSMRNEWISFIPLMGSALR